METATKKDNSGYHTVVRYNVQQVIYIKKIHLSIIG